jgi:ribosomal protein S18 acetylase RimI-like enzyme
MPLGPAVLANPRALAEAADENFVVHATWALAGLAGAAVRAGRDLVVADSGIACDTYNFICRARLDADQAPSRAREAIAYFDRVRRPFSWWVGPADRPEHLGSILEAAGLERAETELAMGVDLSGVRPADPVEALEIRRVATPVELADFARLSAANWSPPDAHVIRFYEGRAGVLLSGESPQWLYVGYLRGEPVATSEVTLGGGVAGLFNISTAARWRRRGIGTAMTRRPLLDARDAGYGVAVLQAAPDGVSLYRQTGFRAFGDITEFKPRP